MASHGEQHDIVDHPEQPGTAPENLFDQPHGGISLDVLRARLDPIEA